MKKETLLDPSKYTSPIAHSPEYLGNMPRVSLEQSHTPEFQQQRRRAIQLGATAISQEIAQQYGEYDLESNLFNLTGHIETFYEGKNKVDAFRREHGMRNTNPSRYDKHEFQEAKQQVTAFNHALKEVINAGGNKLSFSDLLTFVTNMGAAISSDISINHLHEMTREAIIGMRNEVAFEQILIAADIDYINGSEEEDAHGGDFIINGLPVDVKSSIESVERSKSKAEQRGFYGDIVVWSHVDFEDFQGMLCLPIKTVNSKVSAVRQDIIRATRSSYDQQVAGY